MVESAREVCGLVKLGGNNPKRVWWNDEVKTTVRRKVCVCAASNEEGKKRCLKSYKVEMRRLKVVYIRTKRN